MTIRAREAVVAEFLRKALAHEALGVPKLIAQHGRRGNVTKWVSDLKGDCPKRDALQLHERSRLIPHSQMR